MSIKHDKSHRGNASQFFVAGELCRRGYFLHSGSPAAGAFGCWKRGVKETFCERGGKLSQTEWNEIRCRWQEAERERERMETERHIKARKIAAWILSHSKQVPICERVVSVAQKDIAPVWTRGFPISTVPKELNFKCFALTVWQTFAQLLPYLLRNQEYHMP